MKYCRIFADQDGETHFEDVEIPLKDNGEIGRLSDKFPVSSLQFRENKPDYHYDFHTAPDRQFIILLDGKIEITTSQGVSRQFKAGDILLVEDIEGKGHKTKNITQQFRKSIFIKL